MHIAAINLIEFGIMRKHNLFFILFFIQLLFAYPIWADVPSKLTFTLEGIVTDSQGEALPGATVVVEGTTNGTITDMNGKFKLVVPTSKASIRVSYIGFLEQVIPIGKSTFLTIMLKDDSKNLDEVLVVAYGTQKKATLTGAISSIGTDELLKSPSGSVGNALAGAMTGVSSVQMSGQPGADEAKLYIRGMGSLTEGASSPLVLVDGIERSFSQLDPNEIENITILKDASATAVFGVRGANGVLLVTTKRGESGKTKIAITSSVGIQSPTRILKSVDSYRFALAVNEKHTNDNLEGPFKDNVLNALRDNTHPIVLPNTDWADMLLKKQSVQTQHNVTLTGGSKSVRYFTSVGYLFQDGIFKISDSAYNNNFNYNRFNYRTNLDITVTPTTEVKMNLGGRVEVRNEPNTEDGMNHLWRNINWATPLSGAGLVDGKYVKTANDMYVPFNLKDGLMPWYGRGYQKKTKNVLNVDFAVKQKLDVITKGLSVDVKASYNGNFDYNKNRTSSTEIYTPYFKCDLDASVPSDSTVVYKVSGANKELGYSENYGMTRNWYVEGAIRYSRSFGSHSVSGLLLYNQSKAYYPTYNGQEMSNQDIPKGYVGFVGRATYDYAGRYLFEFNAGYNGSENFAPGKKRYGLFPAVSAGWNVSEEAFMKNQKIVDFLKLRASVGLVGNDNLGTKRFLYSEDVYITGSAGYNFGVSTPQNITGVYEGQMGNPLVTWENALKQNYGFDLSILNQRLSLNFDYFFESRDKILITRKTTPGIISANLPAQNLGKVQNSGYEVSLKWEEKIDKFRYWVNGNVSYAHNKIIFMDETRPEELYMAQTGQPVNTPFGRHFYTFYSDGLTYPDGKPLANHSYELKPGDAVYYDLNTDGIIDHKDVAPVGYGKLPEYIFGLRYGFSWNGFDLSMQWTGATNVSRMLGDLFRFPMGSDKYDRALFQYMWDDRWTPETASTAKAPRLSAAGHANNYIDSDLWIRDASYIRLKNVEIGYTFFSGVLRKIGMSSLRLYASGYNLLTFDKLKILDPEETAADGGNYPLSKIYNIGVKVQF